MVELVVVEVLTGIVVVPVDVDETVDVADMVVVTVEVFR